MLDAYRIKHRTVEADGLNIFYREAGMPDAPVRLRSAAPCELRVLAMDQPPAVRCGNASSSSGLTEDPCRHRPALRHPLRTTGGTKSPP